MDDAKRRLEGIDEKMNLVIGFFRTLVTPEQQELGALIARKGGPRAVMRNNDTLKELIQFKSGTRAHSGKPVDSEKAERKGFGADDELDDVKEELFEIPEVAIQKNFEVYTRKFLVQQRELAEEVKTVVRHEGDRVIEVSIPQRTTVNWYVDLFSQGHSQDLEGYGESHTPAYTFCVHLSMLSYCSGGRAMSRRDTSY